MPSYTVHPRLRARSKPTPRRPSPSWAGAAGGGDPFYLAGGTYRIDWAAWGAAPEYPPCAHSAELMAVDLRNATTPRAHVADLAKLVDVPASGGSDQRYVANLKPGYYSLDVASDCSWQFAVSSSS